MTQTPAVILTDALTAFNRAANLALTAAQDQARRDVTEATTEVREARRERDDAVSALHASRLEEQAWKQEAAVWKAAADQTELTVTHQLETITQLRDEATQWKNQCLRLEETSRQEAISWKEQFLRVEQERLKLAQRVEELVAEQLSSGGHAQTSIPPYTPAVRYSDIGDLSASARLQHPSALDLSSPSLHGPRPSKSALSVPKKAARANRTRSGPVSQLPTPLSENQRSARQRPTHETVPSVTRPGSISHGTRQVLIRRVQAVVEVPIKEESLDREGVDQIKYVDTSTSASNVASASAVASTAMAKARNPYSTIPEPNKTTPRVKRKATKRTYVEIDDDSERDNSKQSDGDEYHQSVSDGDDELLMGIEKNRKEVYGMKRVPKSISVQKTNHPSIALKRRKEPAKKTQPPTPSKP